MADTLIQAVTARFDSSGAYAKVAASGGLWFSQIPQDKALPFVGFIHEGEITECTSESGYRAMNSIRMFVFDDDQANVEAIALDIKKAFDLPGTTEAKAAFSIPNIIVISCARPPGQVTYKLGREDEDSPEGNPVYSAMLFYQVLSAHILGTS